MKIYFAGSIRGGRADAALYRDMVAHLRAWGDVLTEHVGDAGLTEKGDDGPNDSFIYRRDMEWLRACDAVVAEVTQPSLGVGYELGVASVLNKPVLALYRPMPGRFLSAMVAGCPAVEVREYQTLSEAIGAIDSFLDKNASRRKSVLREKDSPHD